MLSSVIIIQLLIEVGWMDEINALISDGEGVDFTIQIFKKKRKWEQVKVIMIMIIKSIAFILYLHTFFSPGPFCNIIRKKEPFCIIFFKSDSTTFLAAVH